MTHPTEHEPPEARDRALTDVLVEIAAGLVRYTHASDMLAYVLSRAAAIGCEMAVIMERQDDGWLVRYGYHTPEGLVGRLLSDAEALAATQAAEARDIVVFNNLTQEGAHASSPGPGFVLGGAAALSCACVPLISGNRVIGAMSFSYHAEPHSFTQDEIAFLKRLASVVSLAVENIQLREVESQQRESLEASHARLERAYQDLQSQASELEAILASIPDGLVVNDPSGRVVRMNAVAQEMLRYTDAERSLPMSERLPAKIRLFRPDGSPYSFDEYPPVRALAGEVMRSQEMIMRTPGHPADSRIIASAGPIRTPDGELRGAVTILTDISDLHETRVDLEVANAVLRQQAEQLHEATERLEQRVRQRTASLQQATEALEALAAQNARDRRFLASIMDSVPASIAYLDEHLIFKACNQAAAREYGIPVEQVLGSHLHDVVPGNPEVWAAVEGVLQTGAPFRSPILTVHWENRPESERLRHYLAAYLPDVDEQGRVRGVFAQGQDVTELVVTREQLEQAQAQLQALSRRLVQMQEAERSYVADQLYNQAAQVLAALKMQLWSLERREQHEASAAQLAGMTSALDDTIRALHDLAEHLRPVGLDRLTLADVLYDYVSRYVGAHGLAFTFDAGDTAALRLPPEVVTAVFRTVQEALANTVQHARATRVSLKLEQPAGSLVIVLADNGMGFDAHKAFARGGVGLISMRERIESVGGRLLVQSALGAGGAEAGTVVRIELPLDKT